MTLLFVPYVGVAIYAEEGEMMPSPGMQKVLARQSETLMHIIDILWKSTST